MADRLLVLVPHEHTHAPRSILEQARKLDPDVTEIRAIKDTMELIAHRHLGKQGCQSTKNKGVCKVQKQIIPPGGAGGWAVKGILV